MGERKKSGKKLKVKATLKVAATLPFFFLTFLWEKGPFFGPFKLFSLAAKLYLKKCGQMG